MMKFVLSKKKVIPNTQMTIILIATVPLALTSSVHGMLPYAFGVSVYTIPLVFLAIMIIPYYKINKIREGVLMYVIFCILDYGLNPVAVWIGNRVLADGQSGTTFLIFLIAIILISLIIACVTSMRVKHLSEKWNQQF